MPCREFANSDPRRDLALSRRSGPSRACGTAAMALSRALWHSGQTLSRARVAPPLVRYVVRAARPTSVLCSCGQTGLTFHGEPSFRLDCGCHDCRQAREYESTRGGPATDSALSRLLYLPNDVSTTSADDLSRLCLTQLRDDAKSTRLVTTCCRSTLAVDHPAYRNMLVMVPADSCSVQGGIPAPLARIYMKDWPSDEPVPALEPPTLPSLRGDEVDFSDRAQATYRVHFSTASVHCRGRAARCKTFMPSSLHPRSWDCKRGRALPQTKVYPADGNSAHG